MSDEPDAATDVLCCESCGHEVSPRYWVRFDHEEPCPECANGTLTVKRLGECDRCGDPFTPDDPMHVAVGDDDGFWFAERDPTEIPPDMARVHERCADGYAEWVEEQAGGV